MAFAAKPEYKYVQIVTDKGTCVLRLYNATPKHRDNFVKLAKANIMMVLCSIGLFRIL
ncbi:hypothetical protein [Sphingobacterium sp. E70]|uniref:hypothetical protein n=1 Tax=Sphingobacterium sp. E70 TaxID=2853439 RepID=UPI002795A256|nr:hypothetical protein [Sphingobacterium sp. E70]